jgi:hypothetical protein
MTTVATKEDLKKAKDAGAQEIIVVGEFADKLNKAKKITYLSAGVLTSVVAIVGVAVVAAPETAGISLGVAAPAAAAISGIEIAAIIAASAIGIALIVAVFKDYEEIEAGPQTLTLRRRQK